MDKKITEYNGLKIGDTILILDCYEIKETYIKGFSKDFEHDESSHMITWISHEYGEDHFYDVYTDRRSAECGVQQKKNSYDNYVTSRY